MNQNDQQVVHLEVSLLQPNPLQPRGNITNESLKELAESIKVHGILEPLVVAKTPAGYQIIAGERRWRAAILVGMATVPVIVKETTPRGMLEMALVENVQREDLNPIERAQAYKRLLDEFNLTTSDIAVRTGKSQSYISNTLRLLILPDAIKDGLVSGDTTEGHARAILALEDPKLMIEAYKMLLKEGGSVRVAEELARRLKSQAQKQSKQPGARVESPEWQEEEKELAKILDGQVKISQSKILARATLVMYGNPEETTQRMRKVFVAIKKALGK